MVLSQEVKLWKGRQELIENELPPIVPPKGLSSERQWYLYDNNRRYCRDKCKNLTCPIPDTPQPSSRHSTPGIDEDENAPDLGKEIEVSQSQNPSSEHPVKRDDVAFVTNMVITEEHALKIMVKTTRLKMWHSRRKSTYWR